MFVKCVVIAEIVNGLVSNAMSIVMKWLLSLKTTTKTGLAL